MPILFLLPTFGRTGGLRTLIEWANRSSLETEVTVAAAVGPAQNDLLSSRVLSSSSGAVSNVMKVLGRLPTSTREFGQVAVARRYFRHLVDAHAGSVVIGGFPPWASSGHFRTAPNFIAYAQHDERLWFQSSRGRRHALLGMQADRLIVNSSWLADRIAGNETRLVFPGVDLQTFTRNDAPTVDLQSRRLRVASLGRVHPVWKGLDDLMNACAQFPENSLELTLFGTPDVGETVHEWGRERRVGLVSPRELAAIYQRSDVVVAPSWHESFPLPPLEAMASGAAVVTTSVGVEDYAVDGVNSLVVKPRSPDALARAMKSLAGDSALRTTLMNGGTLTASQFSWDAGWIQFRNAVNDLLPSMSPFN